MSLMCYWALVRNMIRDPYRLEDCPLHLVSTALFVLIFPFFRGDWTETVKLLVIVKLWSNSSTENFQLSEETYIRNSWFLFLHLVQRCRTALGTDKAAQFLPLSKAANLFICVPPIVTKEFFAMSSKSGAAILSCLVSFESLYNGEHAYKIKGGKLGACISHHRWLHSGVMSLSQLHTAFVSRQSDFLASSIGEVWMRQRLT